MFVLENIKKREIWVDNVKVLAISLVVFGHLMQSFKLSGIITDGSAVNGFLDIIYMFHVPLFFICSGFLYQHLTKKQGAKEYGKNILKKLMALGIPYFVFSTVTYLFKTVFSSSVNTQNDKSLADMLFINPTAPYWFLYALFLLFLVSPILKSKLDAGLRLGISLILYIIIYTVDLSFLPGIVHTFVFQISGNLIWFVLGMEISYFRLDEKFNKNFGVLFIVFIAAAILTIVYKINFATLDLILGFVACFAIINLIGGLCVGKKQSKFLAFLSKYIMPIFLMHTIFAAGVRAVLFKFGIQNSLVHIILGLCASFILPIIAGFIMENIRLDFLYSPTKYIKIK